MSPGIAEIKLAPEAIKCKGCKASIRTTFDHRTHWLGSLGAKLIAITLFVNLQFIVQAEQGLTANLIASIVGGWLFGLGFSVTLAPVIQGVVDGTKAVAKVGKKISDKKRSKEDLSNDEAARLAQSLGVGVNQAGEVLIAKAPRVETDSQIDTPKSTDETTSETKFS